jgi:hypothetical protein
MYDEYVADGARATTMSGQGCRIVVVFTALWGMQCHMVPMPTSLGVGTRV